MTFVPHQNQHVSKQCQSPVKVIRVHGKIEYKNGVLSAFVPQRIGQDHAYES